jgi:hypothetical protein
MADHWWKKLAVSPKKKWSRRRILVYETVILRALWTFAGLHLTGVAPAPSSRQRSSRRTRG